MRPAPVGDTVGTASPLVVMVSGAGTLLEALLARAAGPDPAYRIAAVVADRPCRGAEVARAAGVDVIDCPVAAHPDRDAWDVELTARVADVAPDWIVTAGFLRILRSRFLAAFGGRIVNSHPSLLPAFPGAQGVADALEYGVRVTGATVHLVDSGVDTGQVLAQVPVSVADADTVESLHERIKSVERVLLADVVTKLVTRGVVIDGRKAHIP